ncbi:hypothetical protein NMG60_11025956 [Bertholletia excelsa]
MEAPKGWRELRTVETIYEEEEEDDDLSFSSSLSQTLSLPSTPLQGRVESWSQTKGCETDVLIRVQGSCFHLHKDRLATKSLYLKRLLSEMSEITLSPPLNITAETFSIVADFCYGVHPIITPLNVAALRVAAELLELTETDCSAGESFREKTEEYFQRWISLGQEYALVIFRSCLSLMPEAETTAALASRCIEALSLSEEEDDVLGCIDDDVKEIAAEDFEILVVSMRRRLDGSHDLLYRIVDLYLEENGVKLSEVQKTRICNSIDCTMLSSELLMHAVQNPNMPLRFVVRAMFVEQIHTRRSIISAAADRRRHRGGAVSLGTILRRDAAHRDAAQLKASMDATRSRIHCLEKELDGMRKLLEGSDPGTRSSSCRFASESPRIERGETGSISSSGFLALTRRDQNFGSGLTDGSPGGMGSRVEKGSFRRNLINRLKSAFRVSGQAKRSQRREPSKVDEDGEEGGNRKVVVIKKDRPVHRRSLSSA